MNKLTAVLLLASFLTVMLISCSTDESVSSTTQTAASNAATTEADLLAHIPAKDYEGYEFNILGYDSSEPSNPEYNSDGETGDVINDAVYFRNRAVEERFNIKINYRLMSEADVDKTILNTTSAGDTTYDLFTQRAYRIGGAMLSNVFLDWNAIPGIDFTKPWWVADAMEQYNIGDSKYIAVGDMMSTTITYSYGMYFNKRLAADYGIENLYNVVIEGRWTLDYLIKITRDITTDVDGDTKYTFADSYGFATDNYTCIDSFVGSSGVQILGRDDNNLPILTYYSDKMQQVTEKVNELYWGGNHTFVWKDLNDADNHVKLFSEGRALILATPFRDLLSDSMRGMEDDYGVLPYPKFDEAQKDYTALTLDGFGVQMVPITLPEESYERTGAVVEALNAESYRYVRPAIYEVTLKTKSARDEDSIRMLDLVLAGRRYDLASIYASDINYWWMLRELVSSKKTTFTSMYESREEKANKVIAEIIEKYQQEN